MRIKTMIWLVTLGAIVLAATTPLAGQMRIELEGNITSIEGAEIKLFDGLVTVDARGARIETEDDDFTNLSDLKPGAAIAIEAVITENGSIQAMAVEVNEEKDEDTEIGGVIGIVDEAAGTFTIGPIVVFRDGRTKFKGLSRPQAGVFVEAKVEMQGARLVAREVEQEDDDD